MYLIDKIYLFSKRKFNLESESQAGLFSSPEPSLISEIAQVSLIGST